MGLSANFQLLVGWLTADRKSDDLDERRRLELLAFSLGWGPLIAAPIPIFLWLNDPHKFSQAAILAASLAGFWLVWGLTTVLPQFLRLFTVASLLNLTFGLVWIVLYFQDSGLPILLSVLVAMLGVLAVSIHGWWGAEGRDALAAQVEQQSENIGSLNAARERAERTNIAKSEFLGRMSHELRTPLTTVMAYSEMLLETAEGDGRGEQAADLQRINSAGKQMLSMINDIMDISTIEVGDNAPPSYFEPVVMSLGAGRGGGGDADALIVPVQASPDGRERLLIVDDDRGFLEMAERMFTEAGYAPICTDAPQSALQIARTAGPVAIFLDVIMPGFDGWDVLAAVKADSALDGIAVFLIAPLSERGRALMAGADGVVSKPLDASKVKAALAALQTTRGYAQLRRRLPAKL